MNSNALNRKTADIIDDFNSTALANNSNCMPAVKPYSHFLQNAGVRYNIVDSFLRCGEEPSESGWLIHISVIRQQMDHLISNILEYLLRLNLPFILPKDTDCHTMILDGRCGIERTGKVVTVFIGEVSEVIPVAENLMVLTSGFYSPKVLAAAPLNHSIYVSYGKLSGSDIADLNYAPFRGFDSIKLIKNSLKKYHLQFPAELKGRIRTEQLPGLINYQYLPVEILKADAKGDVVKCIKLNRFYNLKWCVVKQGRRFQSFDDYGRDVRDRLEWQNKQLNLLKGMLFLPELIECFSHGGDSYLAYEYIEGSSLAECVVQLSDNNVWKYMGIDNKRKIIGYLLQILQGIENLHSAGIVHRDINCGNFLITNDEKVYLIDLELSFDIINGEPLPPFAFGTPGYISQQQMHNQFPAFEDDVYSLGALMIKVFTGISPAKLSGRDQDQLLSALNFYLEFEHLSVLIARCMNNDPKERPLISALRQSIEVYDALLLTSSKYLPKPADSSYFKGVLKTITSIAGNEVFKKDVLFDDSFYLKSSILFLLNSNYRKPIQTDCNPIKGREGLATNSINLAEGMAGLGLVLLSYKASLRTDEYDHDISLIAETLQKLQETDGSWLQKEDYDSERFKITGFGYGIAGITFFLMEYYRVSNGKTLKESITKGLKWLLSQRKLSDGHFLWWTNSVNQTIDPWLENGCAGIALTFIRAYDLFNENVYKEAAESSLLSNPKFIASNFFTIADGLAGLGITYLEAFRVFGGKEWIARANHITELLLHTALVIDNHTPEWPGNEDQISSNDFMRGNSGISHYLSLSVEFLL